MTRRALYDDERADLLGRVEVAISEVRQVLELATEIGPVLVAAFATTSSLRALREVVDSLPAIAEEQR